MENSEINIEIFRAFVASSDTLITWSLSLFGGSFVCLVSTDYSKPAQKKWKFIYLIFVPAWIFLTLSIYWGHEVRLEGLTAEMPVESMFNIFARINDAYSSQLNNFYVGLIFFGLWLISYFFWWLFENNKSKSNEN